jgi:FkbM family methyltransferase
MNEWLGLLRSLVAYWRPGRQRGLRRLYAPFVQEGDLVFDIGAHLGDRSVAFAALGARVVALEPQPKIARWLHRFVGRHERIQVREEAVGARSGVETMAISRRAPTVSTLSRSWREGVARNHPGFGAVRWERTIDVSVVTLDGLIESHGVPAFCKIDVEGYEAEVLAGLSRPVPALSVEFVAGQLDAAAACVRRLAELADYRFNVVLGERRDFELERWTDADGMLAWLAGGAAGASSGDVYARVADLPSGQDDPRDA